MHSGAETLTTAPQASEVVDPIAAATEAHMRDWGRIQASLRKPPGVTT
jgi:hypothetical protein